MLIEFTKMPKASTIVFRKLMITIPIVLLLLVPVAQSVQLVNAQNSTASNASGGTGAKKNITTTGNKTVIIIPAALLRAVVLLPLVTIELGSPISIHSQ